MTAESVVVAIDGSSIKIAPPSMHTVKERGPSCRVMVPGSQLGPGRKFLTMTLSLTSNVPLVHHVRITKLHCYCKHSLLCIG